MRILANKPAGLFYGIQTLLQMLPPEIHGKNKAEGVKWAIPCVEVRDKPKYGWRAFMLDSGRQYHTIDFLKKYIDLMAMMKMNVFHWHLTESHGWRIEIKKYPKLAEVGSNVGKQEEHELFHWQYAA